MFYTNGDLSYWQFILNRELQSKRKSLEDSRKKLQKVEEMDAYCKSNACRRVYLLNFLGEHFDPRDCQGTCDNCKNKSLRKWNDASSLTAQFENLNINNIGLLDTLSEIPNNDDSFQSFSLDELNNKL